ncbi:MAG TPA: TIGR03435 family protein [Terracidiphilus sp.]|nr:TIGR03435 family protein [Terracidiphilus sp.]
MLTSLVIGILTASAFRQIAAPGPSNTTALTVRFQVATIKPSRPEESRTMQIQGIRFATTDTSVVDLLKYAYGLHEQEIAGGPKWLQTQKFDLVCDPETQTRPSSENFKAMVQTLLADRFHLAAHYETRDLSVFAIVLAKSGLKLAKSTRTPDGIPSVAYAPGHLTAANATMTDLATFLQRFITDRPVIDQTGITGKYDLTLRWTPDELQTETIRDSSSNSLPGFYTAIQEQLGLKLEEEKRPAPVFVIDHIDMPSEN